MYLKINYYLGTYGKLDEKLYKRVSRSNYVYIININDSNVCKIGSSANVFDRMAQIRPIIKSVFPFIENSITYNVYISQPLLSPENKRMLEFKMHDIFKENLIDGEWFKCDFSTAVQRLQLEEIVHVDTKMYKNTLNKFIESNYEEELFIKDFDKFKYYIPIKEVHFAGYMNKYPKDYLKSKSDILKVISDFKIYLSSKSSKEIGCSPNYKTQALNKINKFLAKYSEV